MITELSNNNNQKAATIVTAFLFLTTQHTSRASQIKV